MVVFSNSVLRNLALKSFWFVTGNFAFTHPLDHKSSRCHWDLDTQLFLVFDRLFCYAMASIWIGNENSIGHVGDAMRRRQS